MKLLRRLVDRCRRPVVEPAKSYTLEGNYQDGTFHIEFHTSGMDDDTLHVARVCLQRLVRELDWNDADEGGLVALMGCFVSGKSVVRQMPYVKVYDWLSHEHVMELLEINIPRGVVVGETNLEGEALECVFCHRPGRVREEGLAPECDECAAKWETA